MRIVQEIIEPNVSIKCYTIEKDGKTYVYKDYLDSKGKVVDSELRDAFGFSVFDETLLEGIQNMVDSYEEKQYQKDKNNQS